MTMDLSQTLAALQAMLGQRVYVAIGGIDMSPPLVGTYEGTLAGGSDLGDADRPIFFHFLPEGNTMTSGFFIDPANFRGGRWVGGAVGGELRITLGQIELTLEPREAS